MGRPKFSVVIPYKQRLDNIRLVFAALAEQTLDRSEFEVVVGALEYSGEYVATCQEFMDRLDIVTVMSDEKWNLSRARNLAIRQATGQVYVFLDADMVLPPNCLRNLYDRHYAHGQSICVVGQMIGYDEVVDSQVDVVEALPFSHYREALAALDAGTTEVLDERWSPAYESAIARFPWVFARGGFLALSADTLHRHGLLFDEGFDGWGPEDQEWGFRVASTGTPIVLREDVVGLHLPHARDLSVNGATAHVNNRYYLGKWPRLDLELALVFGWLETDRIYPDVERELAGAAGGKGRALGVVRGTINGRTGLVVGAVTEGGALRPSPETDALFDPRSPLDVLPLAGFALPYGDKSVEECRVLPTVTALSERYREAVLREAERVAHKVLTPAGAERG
ncbi:glycosyltransferase [Streptomyces sp. NPDC088261]|uniref:glycosyltransferase n=1 Tax=Streptomyces sp. NPDC088261 TaxID=3365851 RepID=UPI0038082450